MQPFPTFGIMFFILSRIDIGKKIEESSIMDSEEETNYLHTIDEDLVEELKNEDKEFYNLVKYLNYYGSYPVSKKGAVTRVWKSFFNLSNT